MNRSFLFVILTIVGLLLSACGGGITSYTCSDPLGCVAIASNENLKIANNDFKEIYP